MGFSLHPTTLTTSTATSERKVFTLYWRPLRKYLSFLFALAALLSSCWHLRAACAPHRGTVRSHLRIVGRRFRRRREDRSRRCRQLLWCDANRGPLRRERRALPAR